MTRAFPSHVAAAYPVAAGGPPFLKTPEPQPAVLARRREIVAAMRAIVPGAGVVNQADARRACESNRLTAYRQPPLAAVLPETTAQARLEADVIATGDVGYANQIARYVATLVVHTVEFLDWATGGPPPAVLAASPHLRIESPP